jgi:hypothetical protein
MITLNNKTYRGMKYKVVRDELGTGFKLENYRAVWLNESSESKADEAAKAAIDKKLGL